MTVIAPSPMAMQHGSSVPTMAYAWLSFEPKRDELRRALGADLADAIRLDAYERWWLTSFEDRRSPRPGDDDLRFVRAGPIPDDGQPGTIGDENGAGIVLRPVGAERAVARKGALVPDARTTESSARKGVIGTRRSGSCRDVSQTEAFGFMAALALGIAWWLSREGRR